MLGNTFNFKVGPIKVETALMILGAIAGACLLYLFWGLWQLHLEVEAESTAYKKWCRDAGGEVVTSTRPWVCVKPGALIERAKP